jgi:SOS-response transcriptional repressor LexA
MIDHLRTVQPAAIPLCRWTDYPFRATQTPLPFDHIYRSRRRAIGRRMEAYVVHGARYDPAIGENDVIIVDREAPLDEGEIIACRLDGTPAVGKLMKVAGELWLDTVNGRTRFSECQAPATVIEVRRWLSQRDRT